jgi:PTS system galactitol-specific IIA component
VLQFEESFVIAGLEAENSDQVINELAGRLHQAGLVSDAYGEATIKRELEHPTGLPTRPFPIAFPHADAEGVNRSALAVACLKKPVKFKNMADPDEELEVEIVIMLANKSPEEQIDTLRSLAELFGEPDKLTALKKVNNACDIVDWLKKELALEG